MKYTQNLIFIAKLFFHKYMSFYFLGIGCEQISLTNRPIFLEICIIDLFMISYYHKRTIITIYEEALPKQKRIIEYMKKRNHKKVNIHCGGYALQNCSYTLIVFYI